MQLANQQAHSDGDSNPERCF